MNSNFAEGTQVRNNHDKWGKESVRKKFKKPQKDILKNNQHLKLLQHNEQPQKAKNRSKLRESEKKK